MSASNWPGHLILVGPMGSGKTTIGRATSLILRLPFIDTDQLVETAIGKSIDRLFRDEGEQAFRRAETLAIQRLLVLPDAVVATGGGAVLREENWEYMLASGLVVRLCISPEECARRVAGDGARPLLAGEDTLARLKKLHTDREPFYSRAPLSLDSQALSVQDAARELARRYEEWRASR